MSKPQIIRDGHGAPAFAVIPWPQYKAMVGDAALESALSDEDLFDLAMAEDGEFLPADVAKRLADGENPIRVYRRHRGMTQADLADRAGINAVYLGQIETGKRNGSAKLLAGLANALGVKIDDLM